VKRLHPEIVRIGYFGSYAAGTYAPGSDLDVFIEVMTNPHRRRADRAAAFLPDDFPVPVEIFVYTSEEWERLRRESSSFQEVVEKTSRWLTP